MDLRIVKTLANIENAFVALAATKPVDSITIKQLCDTAMINKATFYLHYDNIDALIQALEWQEVQRFIETAGQAYQNTEHPEQIMEALFRFFSDSPLSQALISGGRMVPFLHKLMDRIISLMAEYRNLAPGSREEIAVSFILYGVFGMIPRYLDSTEPQRKALARQISCLSFAIKAETIHQGESLCDPSSI